MVTGSSSGIGKEIARNLAYFGATVVLACRNRDRGSQALQELVEETGNDRLSMLVVDVSSPRSMRVFVRNLIAGGPVHVLVNNAAVVTRARELSTEGHELTWATNALGYFQLSCLLAPHLRTSAPARIVNVASTLAGSLELDDLQFTRRPFSPLQAYSQSKQANRMLTWALAQRVSSHEVSVHACAPGKAATGLFHEPPGLRGRWQRFSARFLQSASNAARTPTFLASAESVHEQTNQFWIDEKPQPCKFRHDAQMKDLWLRCVEMTQVDLPA